MSLLPSDNGQPDLVNLSNEKILESIFECIRNNDKHTLKGWLEMWKISPFPPPAILYEETPLHVAAFKPKYKECLELLLDYIDSLQININDTSSNGETALHIACRNGCVESVLMLLQKQCDVDKAKEGLDYGESALHFAAEKGHLKIAQYLLDYGASINYPNDFSSTPLHKAAVNDQLEVARFLIEKGANIRASDDSLDEIPLFLACERSHYNMICLLVEHDSSTVNHQNYNKATPLMVASRNSPNEQCVRFLHENGASFSSQDWMGKLALHYAAENKNADVLRYVLEHTDASSIVQCFNDIPNLLKTNQFMDSLLCCAIDSENIECLEILSSSNKLPRSILQTPRFKPWNTYSNGYKVYSPLAFLFSKTESFTNEKFDLYLRFLLEHKLTMLDESIKMILPIDGNDLLSPFSQIFNSAWPFSKQQYYFNWLNANGVTIDYCLQCYYDNTRLFASFDDYSHCYKPVLRAILDNNVEALVLMMSTSAILEPDMLIVQMNVLKICYHKPCYAKSTSHCRTSRKIYFSSVYTDHQEEYCRIYEYLIGLKPIFHSHAQLHDLSAKNKVWCPYNTPNVSREFAESTLKQLCRTTIRHHLRKDTLEANLRDFRRSILELPLPPSLKDYLLFKS